MKEKEFLTSRSGSYFKVFYVYIIIIFFLAVEQHLKRPESRDKLQKGSIRCELNEVKRKWFDRQMEKKYMSILFPGDHGHQASHMETGIFK